MYLKSTEKAGQSDLSYLHLGVGKHCSYSPSIRKLCSLFFI